MFPTLAQWPPEKWLAAAVVIPICIICIVAVYGAIHGGIMPVRS